MIFKTTIKLNHKIYVIAFFVNVFTFFVWKTNSTFFRIPSSSNCCRNACKHKNHLLTRNIMLATLQNTQTRNTLYAWHLHTLSTEKFHFSINQSSDVLHINHRQHRNITSHLRTFFVLDFSKTQTDVSGRFYVIRVGGLWQCHGVTFL